MAPEFMTQTLPMVALPWTFAVLDPPVVAQRLAFASQYRG